MADDNFDPDALLTASAPAGASMKITPQPATPAISDAMRGVLYNVIAPGESSGKMNIIYGGKEFTDLSKHPDIHVPITTGPNAGLYSTAAGGFQFIKPTWDWVAKETGKSDFSKESQETNAAWLAKKTYKDATGRDLETDYASGDPKLRAGIKQALASQWESLGKPGPRQDKLWTLGNDKFRFSDEALTAHDSADDTSLVYMHPEHYLALSPSMDDDPSHSVSGGQALRSSLAKGEPVNNVPHLTLDENGQVVSQDGRSRALMANMAGVDLIPTAIKNIAQLPEHLTGASGNQMQTAGMIPKDQIATEKSGGSIIGRLFGIGQAQAEEPKHERDFFPWLQENLKTKGFPGEVVKTITDHLRSMPVGDSPYYQEWLKADASRSQAQVKEVSDPNLEAVQGNPFANADSNLEPVQGNPFEPDHKMSPAERLGTGMADPIQGGAQLLHHVTPEVISKPIDALNDWLGLGPNPTDANTARRESTIQAQTPNPDRVETRLDSQGRASHVNTGPVPGPDPVRMLGNILSPMNLAAPTKALGAGGVIREMGNAAIQGAAIGGSQPVTGEGNFAAQKTAQIGMGGLAGAVVPPATAATKFVGEWLSSLKDPSALENKAVQTILSRIKASEKGGGPTLQDFLDLINTAPNKPWVLADMPAANLKSLVGKLARSPGEVKQIMQTALTNRDLDTALRLGADVMGPLGEGSIAYTQEALQHARSIMAKEPFEKAYEGGSLAPLKTQFQNALDEATAAERAAGQDLAHAESVQHYGSRESQAIVEKARQKWREADATKRMVMDKLHEVQDDITTGQKGAVWSPRLQEYLNNPRVKQGIQRGLIIERDKALNERRPMNATDYALTGEMDADGNPVVSKVPTMRLLAVAKEGLDAMVYGDQFRNKIGQLDKEGFEIDEMRRGLVAELDRLNPDYKKARDIWAGKSDAMDAMKAGQDIFKMEPEAIESMVHGSSPDALRKALQGRVPDEVIEEAVSRAKHGMTASEKEFFKLGAAAQIRKVIQTTGERGDETRKLILPESKKQLRAMFDSDAEFEKFFSSLNAEHMMFDTWAKTYGGSQTAERQLDDATADMMAWAHAGLAGIEAVKGSPYAAFHAVRAAEKFGLMKTDPALAGAMGRLVTSPAAGAVQKLQAAESEMGKGGPRVTPYLVPPLVYGTEPKHAAGATQGMDAP